MRAAGQEGYWLLNQVEGHGGDELKALAEVNQRLAVIQDRLID